MPRSHREVPRPHPEEPALAGVSKDEAVELEIVLGIFNQAYSYRFGEKEAYLSPSAARNVCWSQDDGAETQSGLRADPGAVPGASTLAA